MKSLIIADHDNAKLKASTLCVMSAASAVGAPIAVLVAGKGAGAVAKEAASMAGVAEVIHADDAAYEHAVAENLAALVASMAKDYTHVFASAASVGKGFMPRAAAMMNMAQISDIISVESPDTFTRPIYAGNAVATVQSGDAVKFITVRCSAFAKAAATGGNAQIKEIPALPPHDGVFFVGEELTKSARPDLASARIVVSGGRALGSSDNFKIIEALADKLGGAVGASRAAVDAGYISNDCQVGQTGKSVAPELYIAAGISGAIQHIAGMKDSKVIVAINKDPEAPIFQVADYGIVGDLFQVVPELTQKL